MTDAEGGGISAAAFSRVGTGVSLVSRRKADDSPSTGWVKSGNIGKEARYRMKIGTVATSKRIAVGLGAITLVVVVNQMHARGPSVLGTKVSNCAVGGVPVPLGPRRIHAGTLSVSLRGGRPAAVLAPPFKLTPRGAQAAEPATISIGARGAKPKTMAVTVVISNASSCPVAVSSVHVTARRNASLVGGSFVAFGGRDRVAIEPGRRITGRAVLPARVDGPWTVDATASADVGAAA